MQYTQRRRCGFGAAARKSLVGLIFAAIIVTSLGTAAMAADGIMLQIRERPLKEVVMLLTQQSGMNIVIADESKLEKRVTISLNNVSLDKALDYVVKSAGISYRKMEDGTYIIGGVSDTPALSASDFAEALPTVEATPVVEPKKMMITTIKLVHSRPSELLRALGWTGQNPLRNCEPIYPKRLGGSSSAMNVVDRGGSLYKLAPDGAMYDIGNGVKPMGNQPVIPTVDLRSSGSGRTADSFTGAGQTTAMPPGMPRSSGTSGGGNQATTTRNSSSDDGFMPDGIIDYIPFDPDNSIIVKGDEDGIDQFKEMIRMLDVPPKQVQIKAEFVEVKTVDIKKFGIDWTLKSLNQLFDTQFGPAGNVNYTLQTGNLTAKMAAQLSRDVGTTRNSPIISTINNQNAYISINTVIPYWVSSTTVVDGDQIVSSNANFIEIDTSLEVLPRVNGDGTITMTLMPRIGDRGNDVTGPGGESIPETRNEELYTQRRVANGETIVVGGFIRKNESNSTNKIPIIGDLPIIGSLFRTTAKTTEDRELLIFVTPTIIPEPGGGTVGGGLTP